MSPTEPKRQAAAPSASAKTTDEANRDNLGFLLAKASQRWNELLQDRFVRAGYPDVRPSYGSILIPLFEEDGLRLSELASRARLSKQTMTTMTRMLERAGLAERRSDPSDGRASLIYLTNRARAVRPIVELTLAELDQLAAKDLTSGEVVRLKEALRLLRDLDG